MLPIICTTFFCSDILYRTYFRWQRNQYSEVGRLSQKKQLGEKVDGTGYENDLPEEKASAQAVGTLITR